ncbi:MAG: hypothetical protein A3F90_06375 [Deltaproteobacteria bacterium RIFCSPLOWO2_12_FULL_60_19]|nr:MAG: hypothetical protein A3F90_06375 [Deltaproteobacteria bacterium RIFCSPLOWO2_12_FULL_60_19]
MKNENRKMQSVKSKTKAGKRQIFHFAICIFHFAFTALIFSGCAATGEVQTGRYDLLYGDSNKALGHFQRAAEIDPQFLYYSVFPQGVWTYVGRANYRLGKYPEARQAFERALTRYDRDHLARLYLGLVLGRDGDRPRGLKEIQAGMKGLHGWIEDIIYTTPYGRFWDPSREIRSGIEKNLALTSGKEINWPEVIAGGEWLGKRMEEEIDLARKDERDDFFRDGDGEEP